jgi:hypothetical protein
MWATTCGCQLQHQILSLKLRALNCLVIAEFDSAIRAICPWQIVSDCLGQSGVLVDQALARTRYG